MNILTIYIKKITMKKKTKKKQIVQCRVSFTDNIANKISPTIKFISEYSDGRKCPSIYSDDIKDNITVGFKKANRTVT
jgi:hypothetical protein